MKQQRDEYLAQVVHWGNPFGERYNQLVWERVDAMCES